MNCGCGNEIHPERVALGFKVCVVCGEKFAQAKRPYGIVVYSHKTAGAIQITDKKMFNVYKKVSRRIGKASNMGSASLQTTALESYQ
jgi:hypothetical protein